MPTPLIQPAAEIPVQAVQAAASGDTLPALCAAGELFGGVERHVLDLCRYLRGPSGRAPLLVVFNDGELASRAREVGADVRTLSGRHRYDTKVSDSLAELLLRENVRVVHSHGYKATVIAAIAGGRARRARRGVRIALVKTEHGLLEPSSSAVQWIKMHANRAVDWLATRAAVDAVCYVTADLQFRWRLAHAGLRRSVVHNGIEPLDRSRYSRPLGLDIGSFHVGIVGRVTAVKGIRFALEAVAAAEMPWQVCLNIIGTGPAEEGLRRLADELGVQGRVRFHGFSMDAYAYMSHMDALLMPSLHEGLPYTLLEAMSLGVPVVASRVGGLAEVIEDGRTGMLVPAGDPGAIAGAIRRLVEQPGRAAALGLNGAREQRRAYTLDAMADAYRRVYDVACGLVPSTPGGSR